AEGLLLELSGVDIYITSYYCSTGIVLLALFYWHCSAGIVPLALAAFVKTL
ncbi:MAG: hypothetical protein ACJA2Q_002865, partial [Pseudohongiellaceae bacterium]